MPNRKIANNVTQMSPESRELLKMSHVNKGRKADLPNFLGASPLMPFTRMSPPGTTRKTWYVLDCSNNCWQSLSTHGIVVAEVLI